MVKQEVFLSVPEEMKLSSSSAKPEQKDDEDTVQVCFILPDLLSSKSFLCSVTEYFKKYMKEVFNIWIK